MFSRQMNQIRIDLSITPNGPLLIRSGRQGADPTRPNLECVRTTVDGAPSVFIPGSSLKGVSRAHAERLMRSEGLEITDTFERSQAFRQGAPGVETYSKSCPLGRTFGNLHVKGHVSVSDLIPGGHAPPGSDERTAELAKANAVEQRNGVGIDRLLGSASTGALFDEEAVVQGRFDGRILLRNVQLYQLALVLLVLRDLDEGFLQLGSSTTRGHGFVRADIRSITVESRRGKSPEGHLLGLGELLPDAVDAYRLVGEDRVELPAGLRPTPKLMWDRLVVPGDRVDDFAEALVEGPWIHFLGKVLEWQAQQKGERIWAA